jgi:hypothetical protein
MTNLRIHVQLKGTNLAANADESVSISVRRENLNYLLAQAYSIYICYHAPSGKLLVQSAENVFREYEHKDKQWRIQNFVTIKFKKYFSQTYQNTLHDLVLSSGKSSRDSRVSWSIAQPGQVAQVLHELPQCIDIPHDINQAYSILSQLYAAGQDTLISAHFPQFSAVLGAYPELIAQAYMSEINLGLVPCHV